jgi:hypothetical protein
MKFHQSLEFPVWLFAQKLMFSPSSNPMSYRPTCAPVMAVRTTADVSSALILSTSPEIQARNSQVPKASMFSSLLIVAVWKAPIWPKKPSIGWLAWETVKLPEGSVTSKKAVSVEAGMVYLVLFLTSSVIVWFVALKLHAGAGTVMPITLRLVSCALTLSWIAISSNDIPFVVATAPRLVALLYWNVTKYIPLSVGVK